MICAVEVLASQCKLQKELVYAVMLECINLSKCDVEMSCGSRLQNTGWPSSIL